MPQQGNTRYPLTVDQYWYVDFRVLKSKPNQGWPYGGAWVNLETGLGATLSGDSWSVSVRLPGGANLPAGPYELKVVTYNNARTVVGRIQNITIDNVRLNVAIRSHQNGANDSANVSNQAELARTVADNVGGSGVGKVMLVIIRADGALWKGWEWRQEFVGIPTQITGNTWRMVMPASNGAGLPTGAQLALGQYRIVADAYDLLDKTAITAKPASPSAKAIPRRKTRPVQKVTVRLHGSLCVRCCKVLHSSLCSKTRPRYLRS